jgi:hypothetical protein
MCAQPLSRGIAEVPDKLRHVRIGLDEANAFVLANHRHHKPVVGHLFSLGASVGDQIVGVAIVGRPVSRFRDDGLTAEVTRLCTDGTPECLLVPLWRISSRRLRARVQAYRNLHPRQRAWNVTDGHGLADDRRDAGEVVERPQPPQGR